METLVMIDMNYDSLSGSQAGRGAPLELNQLRYFEAVARHLHFTRAAQELNVAQPSVSQQLGKLEKELGADLFHRMKRRVALTPAGEVLLPRARRLLADLEEARAEVQELTGLRKGH